MKKLIFTFIILLPLLASAQQPKMHIKFFAGFNVSSLVYRADDVDSDILGGIQLGGGFRIEHRKLFAEIDIAYMARGITYTPRDDDLDIDEDVTLILRDIEIPILVGYIPLKTPVFGIFLYGGLANRFTLSGRIDYGDEEIKFKPKEAKLHFYNLGARFGFQIDLAMFNFDLSYTIGVTNSFRDRTRTNSHMVMLNVGLLF